MKQLLQQKADLEKQLDEVIRTTDHSSLEDRSRMIEQSQPLLGGMKKIEDTLAKQRAQLGRMIQDVLEEVHYLAETGSHLQISALLEAVGDLPRNMFEREGFEWDALRRRFGSYQKDYRSRHDYVRTIDEIHRIG